MDALRKELDLKIESKTPIWIFTILVMVLVAVFGGIFFYYNNLSGRMSSLESKINK